MTYLTNILAGVAVGTNLQGGEALPSSLVKEALEEDI